LVAPAADLAHIDRTIRKEPHYQHEVKYALLVFGPEAKFKVWLALDGDVLYVDKNGDGDLTAPEKRFPKEKGKYIGLAEEGSEFKAGDITVGTQVYKNLDVHVDKLTHLRPTSQCILEQIPTFQKLKAADPEPWCCSVSVEVPVGRPVTNLSGQHVGHVAYRDPNGFLQFAGRPSDAPVIHFGGPWKVWPGPEARFIAGRPEQFPAHIGTPGHGPGTFAASYDFGGPKLGNFVPKTARPVVEVQFRVRDGRTISGRYVLEDRC
jgi:hypothetical protein